MPTTPLYGDPLAGGEVQDVRITVRHEYGDVEHYDLSPEDYTLKDGWFTPKRSYGDRKTDEVVITIQYTAKGEE